MISYHFLRPVLFLPGIFWRKLFLIAKKPGRKLFDPKNFGLPEFQCERAGPDR
jgi:hypothetical protein